MTRSIAHLYMDTQSLGVLRGLLGRPWGAVTGEIASEAPGFTVFSWAEVAAEVAGQPWSFSSELTTLEFEGFEAEYPVLRVTAGGSQLADAAAAGRVFLHHRGETVESIVVMRETIARVLDGVEQWEFSTDYAVVFQLTGGAVCVAKGGHRDEALFVTIADDVDSLQIPDRSIEWDWGNELGESYRVHREWIPLEHLAAESE